MPCLFSNVEIDLKKSLQRKNRDYEIKASFDLAMNEKLKGTTASLYPRKKYMFQIGG